MNHLCQRHHHVHVLFLLLRMSQFHPDWNCRIEKRSHLIPMKKKFLCYATFTCLHRHRLVSLCGITVIPQFMGSVFPSKTAYTTKNQKIKIITHHFPCYKFCMLPEAKKKKCFPKLSKFTLIQHRMVPKYKNHLWSLHV